MQFVSDAQRRAVFAALDDGEVRSRTRVPKALEEHARQLPPHQMAALRAYNVSGKDINEQLMAGHVPARTKDVDDAINSAPRTDVVVYRGKLPVSHTVPGLELAMLDRTGREAAIRANIADQAERQYQPGTVVSLGAGYQSASFDTTPALDASLGRTHPGMVFEIHANQGVYLGGVPGLTFDDEAEYLMPADSRFKVIGVIRQGKLYSSAADDDRERVIVKLQQVTHG